MVLTYDADLRIFFFITQKPNGWKFEAKQDDKIFAAGGGLGNRTEAIERALKSCETYKNQALPDNYEPIDASEFEGNRLKTAVRQAVLFSVLCMVLSSCWTEKKHLEWCAENAPSVLVSEYVHDTIVRDTAMAVGTIKTIIVPCASAENGKLIIEDTCHTRIVNNTRTITKEVTLLDEVQMRLAELKYDSLWKQQYIALRDLRNKQNKVEILRGRANTWFWAFLVVSTLLAGGVFLKLKKAFLP